MTAFGVNAIVLAPGIETGFHYHDRQEELYFVHRGTIEMEFGDGSTEKLAEGSFPRVDPPTLRKIRNRGDVEAVYVIVGARTATWDVTDRRPRARRSACARSGAVSASQSGWRQRVAASPAASMATRVS